MALTALKTKNAVESLRDVVQDLLVPEFKAIKAELESVKMEMRLRDQQQTERAAQLGERITEAGKRTDQHLQHLSEKLDLAINIRERLVALEARQPKA